MLVACRGLIWEEWRRTRKLALGVLAVMIGGSFAFFLLGRRFEAFQQVLSSSCLLTLILYLPVSHSTANDIQAGIPKRRYLLPIGTFSLVFWPLLYRLALVAAMFSVHAILSIGLFDSARPQWASACALVAATALIHMLAWSARLVGKWLTVLGALFLFVLFHLGTRSIRASLLPSPWAELAVASAATLVTLFVTTIVLGILRTGGLGLARKVEAQAGVKGAVAAHSSRSADEPFRSTFLAQVWFEWRAGAARMTLILCCAVCMFLLLLPSFGQASFPASLVVGWRALAIVSILAGLWTFATNRAAGRRSPARFEHTRPEDDAMLAWARLASAGATVVVCYVVVTIFALASSVVFTKLGLGIANGPQARTVAPALSTQCVIVFAALAATWIGYTRGIVVVLFWLMLGCEELLAPDLRHEVDVWLWNTPQTGFQFVLLISVLLLLKPFVSGLRRGILSHRAIAILAACWALGTIIISRSFSPAVLSALSLPIRSTFVLWVCGAAITLLALSPFASVPLQIGGSRHG